MIRNLLEEIINISRYNRVGILSHWLNRIAITDSIPLRNDRRINRRVPDPLSQ